jgi:hypothetical protein
LKLFDRDVDWFVMVSSDWEQIKQAFLALSGDVQNLEPRVGIRGRGLFSLDSSNPSRIFCPKELFLPTEYLQFLDNGGITIMDGLRLPDNAINFLHHYYNYWSWSGGGRLDALSFLEGLSNLPIQYRHKLIALGLLSPSLLIPSLAESSLYRRFIFTRTVSYEGSQVLAPVWDLVNHSAFSQPFRSTRNGIETPPRGDEQEHLFKYSILKSPLGMWAHYGFSCHSTVAFSCPITLSSVHTPLVLRCLGEHYSEASYRGNNLEVDGRVIVVRCLPIGSLSAALPAATLLSLLRPLGLADAAVYDFFRQLIDWNVAIRSELLREISHISSSCLDALRNGLSLELDLIAESGFDWLVAA